MLVLPRIICLAPAWADVHIVDASGETVTSYAASHALVIGISDYTEGWSDLPSVPEEVAQVADVLGLQGFDVEIVLDPDEDRLREALNGFVDAHGYAPNNRLLIFYSGHGHSRRVNGEQRGYLVPGDAPLPTPATLPQFLAKAVPMLDVVAWARKIEARHALFVFDSCFSGTVLDTKSGLPDPAYITDLTGRSVRQFLTAGRAGQSVPGKSVFTPALVRALGGEADLTADGYVTGTELGVYLYQQVAPTGQTPQHGRLLSYHEGDFVFRLSRQEPPVVSNFDIQDLQNHSAFELRWLGYQQSMEAAYAEVQTFASEDASAATKAAAWQRFLETFAAENPLSFMDNTLRQQAEEELSRLQLPAKGAAVKELPRFLSKKQFSKVGPGMSPTEVREIIGPPRRQATGSGPWAYLTAWFYLLLDSVTEAAVFFDEQKGRQWVQEVHIDATESELFERLDEPESKDSALIELWKESIEPKPIQASGDILAPVKLSGPNPEYTEAACRARIQGVIIVQSVIDSQGQVTQLKILKGLGYGLDEAAMEAMKTWRFQPARKDSKPVAVFNNLVTNLRVDEAPLCKALRSRKSQ